MVVHQTELEGVLILEPAVHGDLRGHFLEAYNERTFAEIGIKERFVQDNQSRSRKGVLRGLHYQVSHAQAKLIRVLQGEVFDVVVDVRAGSPTFGKWTGIRLTAEGSKTIWIPKGFAHGFYTLSEFADVSYKVSDFYRPESEKTLLWSDPDVSIRWPLEGEPVLSEKDRSGHLLWTLREG